MYSKWDKKLEQVDKTFKRYSERRKKNIYQSLYRPLYQEILKCIFLTIIIIINSLLLLEILFFLKFPFNFITIFISFILIIYFEIRIYNIFWGKNGKWSINKYIKIENK